MKSSTIAVVTLVIAALPYFACSCSGRPPVPRRYNNRIEVPARHKLSVKGALNSLKQSVIQPLATPERQHSVIQYEGFTVAFSSQMHIPLAVSYELTAEKTDGPYSRKGKDYTEDPQSRVSQADDADYRNSGYSRGHMAPAADFKWSDRAMSETFYYTNICPQDRDLNNRYWNTLENKVRDWANQFGKVYVVTGPVVGDNPSGTIGHHNVVVPDAFYKVIIARTGNEWTSIAFVMQNTSSKRLLKDCVTTVNSVEKMCKADFFEFLDDEQEESVEDILDYKTWGIY